jgi:hypothetical protein
MITRTLFRRLERLEMSFQPAVKREPHTIKFVDANGTVTSSLMLGPDGASTWTHFEDGIAEGAEQTS